jgi:cell division septation protein DedD
MPRSRVVHRIELPSVTGSSSQVRLDSRITVPPSSSADVQTFFDAGIIVDVDPKVFQSRDISLATSSQVRIRRGPDTDGVQLVIFENPSSRFDTRIQEGDSIVLGGLITAAERMTLPDMPIFPDNPILNYLYPKSRELKDRPEIAILLTPRIVGIPINAAADAPVIASEPAIVSPPVASVPTPSAGTMAALVSPTPSITSAFPSNTPPVVNSSPVVASPPAVASTVAVNRPPVVTPPSIEIEGIGGKYTVQVGAFDQLDKAEALRSQLAKNYVMVFVEKVATGKTPYRVRVGRFSDMQSARKIERQLESDGMDTYVTTLN